MRCVWLKDQSWQPFLGSPQWPLWWWCTSLSLWLLATLCLASMNGITIIWFTQLRPYSLTACLLSEILHFHPAGCWVVFSFAYGDRKQLVCEEPPDEARAVAFLLQRMKKMLCFPICRMAKRSDPNLCHGVPNGQAEKRVQWHSGLEKRKASLEKWFVL